MPAGTRTGAGAIAGAKRSGRRTADGRRASRRRPAPTLRPPRAMRGRMRRTVDGMAGRRMAMLAAPQLLTLGGRTPPRTVDGWRAGKSSPWRPKCRPSSSRGRAAPGRTRCRPASSPRGGAAEETEEASWWTPSSLASWCTRTLLRARPPSSATSPERSSARATSPLRAGCCPPVRSRAPPCALRCAAACRAVLPASFPTASSGPAPRWLALRSSPEPSRRSRADRRRASGWAG
mmetsp:Transcript_104700/g.278578  ORF Transcript_104700/g.278578 Transcript_104700/m.278578 type:complete len:234 (-) Transcript_104700:111-812(-)